MCLVQKVHVALDLVQIIVAYFVLPLKILGYQVQSTHENNMTHSMMHF